MSPRSPLLVAALAAAALLPAALRGQEPPPRPAITGLSHVALWVSDLDRSRAFYTDFLGFDESYALRNTDGSVFFSCIKVNDRQWLELFPSNGNTPGDGDRLYHVAIETADARGLLAYLKAKGVKGPGGKPLPAAAPVGKVGNLNYFTEDPDGHIIEFVQYMPGGWTVAKKGQFMPATRVSQRMSHAGIAVANLDASLAFYRDILGFREFWRGSGDGKTLSWVNLRVPDGNDYLELMLYAQKPSAGSLHVLHHVCLEVPDVDAVRAALGTRTLPAGCRQPTAIRTGVNRKRQINFFDPDGTRVEVMEAATVDGIPARSSDAPPPGSQAGIN
jgi:lactoylglutathione lyase